MKRLTAFAAAAAALLALAACAGPADNDGPSQGAASGTDATAPQTTAPSTPAAQVTPPVMADVASLDGTTVDLPLSNVLVLQGDTDPVTDWQATTDPTGIVEFQPGRNDGSATFNPGFSPLKEGTTHVTVTNTTSGTQATFTVTVGPAQ